MAKNDNLTDFLTGLADKLRSLLSTADPINPQEFEDKIQGVYDKGFSEGGPDGITATAADVLSGKVFGSGGSAKATGTMPNRSDVSRPTKYQATDGAHLYSWIPYGFCANYDGNGHLIEQPFSSVASAIGLTAAKIVKGNTILGVSGSSIPSCGVNFKFSNGGYTENEGEKRKLPDDGYAWGGASIANTRYAKLPAGSYFVVGCCGYLTGGQGKGGKLYVCKSGALGTSICDANVVAGSNGSGNNTIGTFYTTFTLSAATTITIALIQDAGAAFYSFGAVCITKK